MDISVSFDPKYPDMKAVYSDNQDPTGTYQQRLGNTLWNVEFSAWDYSWQRKTDRKWDNPSFDGPFYCPDKCGETKSYCSTPSWVFDFEDPEHGQAFKLNLYAFELFTINRESMDPGHIGCAKDTVGSEGKLGYLEPTSASSRKVIIRAHLIVQPHSSTRLVSLKATPRFLSPRWWLSSCSLLAELA
jgi:hypothetical protein